MRMFAVFEFHTWAEYWEGFQVPISLPEDPESYWFPIIKILWFLSQDFGLSAKIVPSPRGNETNMSYWIFGLEKF